MFSINHIRTHTKPAFIKLYRYQYSSWTQNRSSLHHIFATILNILSNLQNHSNLLHIIRPSLPVFPGEIDSLVWNLFSVTWWRHQMETFSVLLALCACNTVNFPHKGQWRRALVFSLICAWINGCVNNREAGDLRRHRAYYDFIVMYDMIFCISTYTS